MSDTTDATGTNDERAEPSSEQKKRPSPTSRARRIGGASPRPTRPAAAGQGPPAAGRGPAADQARPAEPVIPTPAPVELAKPRPVPAPPGPAEAARPDTPGPARGSGVPLRWLPAGLLAIAALTLVVLVVVFSHGVYWAKSSDSSESRTVAQGQVLAAAKKCFVQINTYDYRHLDGLAKDDLACTTGTFSADLKKALDTQILKLAPKVHARQSAQINYTGIVSVSPDGDQVVVLVYGQLNQTNDSTANKQPRVDIVDAVVTVSNVHGKWLISKVDSDIPAT